MLRLQEEMHQAWGWNWIDNLGRDLQYACLRRISKAGLPPYVFEGAASLRSLAIPANIRGPTSRRGTTWPTVATAYVFGKLTMDDTDMVLIDMDPDDPFDFFLDGYIEQLVAGYTKNTRENGLRVFMRDYNKVKPATPR